MNTTANPSIQQDGLYYSINEEAARRAKEANSFSDYIPGSATAEYRQMVDKAAELAERQKRRVDPEYHSKIDHLLDLYARKLAANMNEGYTIAARVPSVLIAGPANFPARKKEKQNAASDRNMFEWQYIQGLLDRIRSTGMGGISADDADAITKLERKLVSRQEAQEHMKAVNAYYRKHNTLDGCPNLTSEEIEALKQRADMSYKEALAYARNEIYARMGYAFNKEGGKYTEHYSQYEWYRNIEKRKITEDMFNRYERVNIDLILKAEDELEKQK